MTDTKLTKGARLLAGWVGERTQVDVAEILGVMPQHLNLWLRGRRRPGIAWAWRIQTVTKGSVPVEAWLK